MWALGAFWQQLKVSAQPLKIQTQAHNESQVFLAGLTRVTSHSLRAVGDLNTQPAYFTLNMPSHNPVPSHAA